MRSTNLNEIVEPNPPIDLHERAMENLSFIRDTMARSSPMTAVSGWGTMAMGALALAGSYVASRERHVPIDAWIYTWLAVAAIGCLIGLGAMLYKANRRLTPVFWAALRKFGFALFPPIVAGMILTEVLYEHGLAELMPGTWLLLYGVAIVTGGTFSVPVLPLMGVVFMAAGVLAFYPPVPLDVALWGRFTVADAFLAGGFGLIHLACGAIIAWRYGG